MDHLKSIFFNLSLDARACVSNVLCICNATRLYYIYQVNDIENLIWFSNGEDEYYTIFFLSTDEYYTIFINRIVYCIFFFKFTRRVRASTSVNLF